MTNGKFVEAPDKEHVVRTYYEVLPRKFSSDVVAYTRVHHVIRHGKPKEEIHREIVLIPTQKKVYGDQMAEFTAKMLNENGNNYEF